MKFRKLLRVRQEAFHRFANCFWLRVSRPKGNARFNAVTLGLFAKHVVVPMCDGDGSKVEFRRLVADLQQEFQPVGTRYLEDSSSRGPSRGGIPS